MRFDETEKASCGDELQGNRSDAGTVSWAAEFAVVDNVRLRAKDFRLFKAAGKGLGFRQQHNRASKLRRHHLKRESRYFKSCSLASSSSFIVALLAAICLSQSAMVFSIPTN